MRTPVRAIACALPITLSACFANNVRDMREREPVLVADSARDPTSFSTCVSETWVAHGMTPRSVPRSGGTTIVIEIVPNGMPLMVVDADARGTGSHVTMRLFKSMWSKQNRGRIEQVRACL